MVNILEKNRNKDLKDWIEYASEEIFKIPKPDIIDEKFNKNNYHTT